MRKPTELRYDSTRTPVERIHLARNPVTPAHILATLYDPADENRTIGNLRRGANISENSLLGGIYIELASNPNTPNSIARKLLTNGSETIGFLSFNTKDPEILETLSAVNPTPTQGLAANPHTPPHILTKLLMYGSGEVNHLLAENPNTPDAVLGALLKTHFYRQPAEENLKSRPEYAGYPIEWIEQILPPFTLEN